MFGLQECHQARSCRSYTLHTIIAHLYSTTQGDFITPMQEALLFLGSHQYACLPSPGQGRESPDKTELVMTKELQYKPTRLPVQLLVGTSVAETYAGCCRRSVRQGTVHHT
jgi:hypothetical protein